MTILETLQMTARVMKSLQHVGKVGAEGGAKALSEMLAQPIELSVPTVSMMPLIDLPHLYPPMDLERICVAVYVPFAGDADGSLALILREQQASEMLKAIGLPPGEPGALDEMQQSALREIGNIVASAYLNALANMGEMQILPHPPGLAQETVAAVLGAIAADAMQYDEYGLIMNVHMSLPNQSITPEMLLLPRPAGLATILKSIGGWSDEKAA